jgi:hypothetical protein
MLIFEPDHWWIEADLLCLSLDSLVDLRSPGSSTVTGWSGMVNIQSVEASLKARIVQIQVPSVINRRGFQSRRLQCRAWGRFGINHHWRRVPP